MRRPLIAKRRTSPHTRRRIALEKLEPRHLFAAMPLGASPLDTAEFMLGTVGVVPVLFESNGAVDPSTEQWTSEAIQAVLDKVHTGVNWWSEVLDRLGTVHTLDFVIDETFARNPVETVYEPISRTSQEHALYVGAFMEQQGFGDSASLQDAVRSFNHAARERMGTDWAFSIFIVNSFNDGHGQFAPGSEFNHAFAYPGGLYAVVPSTRPASTIAHEMGHIFWTRDEYPGGGSWTDRRGYYNAQNLNAADNPTPGFVQEPSIMRSGTPLTQSFNSFTLPESTMAMVGWRDSNGNGIFDLADVPLSLEGTGIYDAGQGVFTFSGFATAVALPNQNSSGPQNDITLNRVDRIEYRLDGGPWQTAMNVGRQASPIDFAVSTGAFSTIEVRAIDDRIGITSEIFATDAFMPLLAGASLGGIGVVAASGEGEPGRPKLIDRITATVTRIDGVPLRSGTVNPEQFGVSGNLPEADGVTFVSLGHTLDGRVGAVSGANAPDGRSLGFYNTQFASWQDRWAPDKKLLITFDQPVGHVELDAFGLDHRTSYGRLEAYDADGNLLTRVSTQGLKNGETETMAVRDAAGRIASVRAFGHAWTEIGLGRLSYGAPTTVTSDNNGVFSFSGLPDGDYRMELTPERLIHRFVDSEQVIRIRDGVTEAVAATFERIRSPWNNPGDPFDVSGNDLVEPLDALLVLNKIARSGAGILRNPEQMTHFVDVNNDGELTPLDALMVLNEISRRARAGAAEGETAAPAGDQSAAADSVFAHWPMPDEDEKETEIWNAEGTGEVSVS